MAKKFLTTIDAQTGLLLPRKTDPGSPVVGEIWVNVSALKFRDNGGAPATRTVFHDGTTVPVANGGTGLTATTVGGLPIGTSTTAFTNLVIGANGTVLTSNGTTATWVAPSGFSGSIANTQVAYGSGANAIQGSANYTFDGTNLLLTGTGTLRIARTNSTFRALSVEGTTSGPNIGIFAISPAGGYIGGNIGTSDNVSFAGGTFWKIGALTTNANLTFSIAQPGTAGASVTPVNFMSVAPNTGDIAFSTNLSGAKSLTVLQTGGGVNNASSPILAVAPTWTATGFFSGDFIGSSFYYNLSGTGTVDVGGTATSVALTFNKSTTGSAATVRPLSVAAITTAGTITNLIYVDLLAPSISTTTITNFYGIRIADITGATNNFAISTGTGIVSFGDIVLHSASTTTAASMRIPHGTAPTSPVNGDLWTTTAGLFARINGVSTQFGAATSAANTQVVYGTGSGVTSDAAFTRATNALTVDSGADAVFTAGFGKMGFAPGGTTGFFYIGQAANFTPTTCMMFGNTVGDTFVNAATGKTAKMGINGAARLTVANLVTTIISTLTLTPNTVASGTSTAFVLNGGANTNMTLSTEVPDVDLALNRVVQWATGPITTQRAVVVRAPTYAFVGASTITTAATVSITGAPVAGTNATITNPYALLVESGIVKINDVTAAGSATTGAFQVVGSIGCGNRLWVGSFAAFDAAIGHVVVSKTATYTITTADGNILVDATSGNVVLTLPAANFLTNKSQIITIVRIDSSVNTVTVQRGGTDTLNGGTAGITIPNTIGFTVHFRSNGSNAWYMSSSSTGGTIGGSIGLNQVAVGSGTNTVSGSSALTFNGTTLTANAGFQVNNSTGTYAVFLAGDQGGAAGVEIGRTDGTASTSFIDFHNNATALDYDVRIACTVGGAALGQGTLQITGGTTQIIGGTVTASTNPLTVTQTWNNAGVVFNGLLVNITNTASNATSTLFDFQVNGSSFLNLQRSGNLTLAGNFNIPGGTVTAGGFSQSNTNTATTGGMTAVTKFTESVNPASASAAVLAGSWSICQVLTGNAQNFTATNAVNGGGAINAVYAQAIHNGTGTVTEAIGLLTRISTTAASGTVSNAYNIRISDVTKSVGTTFTNQYGLYIDNQTQGGTSNYAIFTNTGLVSFGDEVLTTASTTTRAGLNIPHGTAPTTPVNGDVWTTTAGLFAQINGTTVAYTGSTFSDSNFRVQDNGDATKQLAFEVSGVATATTRTWTVPNYGGVVALSSIALTSGRVPFSTATGLADVAGFLFDGTSVLTVGGGSTAAQVKVNGVAGSTRNFTMQTAGAARWHWSTNATAENPGTSQGSDLELIGFFDNATPEIVLTVFRVGNGAFQFARQVKTAASTTTIAGLNVPHGSAPTSPVNGDVWTTTAGLFARINGATVAYTAGGGTIGGSIANTQIAFGSGANTIQGSAELIYSGGTFALQPAATSSGLHTSFVFNGASDTNIPASFENVDVNINLNRTVTWLTGNFTNQRAFRITSPTYGFVAASTITNAATFAITSAPSAGANATITNAYSLWVQAGKSRFDGPISVAGAMTWSSTFTATSQILQYIDGIGTAPIESYINVAASANSKVWDITNSTTKFIFRAVDDTYSTTTEWLSATRSGTTITQVTISGATVLTPPVVTSGTQTAFTVTGAANTGLTASTEVSDINFNLNRTVQWATGNITTQRAFVIQAPTYSFVSASTITNSATLAITGGPAAGTNATMLNRYALWVQSGFVQFDAGLTVTGNSDFGSNMTVTSTQPLLLNQTALVGGSSVNAFRVIGGAHTALTASTESSDIRFNLVRTVQWATGALTTQRAVLIEAPTYGFVAASTITNAATLAISAAPAAGANATITNSYALWVQAGKSRFDSINTSTSVDWAGISSSVTFNPSGVSTAKTIAIQGSAFFSGATTSPSAQIVGVQGSANLGSTGSYGWAKSIEAVGVTGSGAAVTNAAGVYIAKAFYVTNPNNQYGLYVEDFGTGTPDYAIWVEGGKSRFKGPVTVSGTVFTPSGLASTTAVTTWQSGAVSPLLTLVAAAEAAEGRNWDLTVNTNTLALRLVNDAYSTAISCFEATRSGFTITGTKIGGTSIPGSTYSGCVLWGVQNGTAAVAGQVGEVILQSTLAVSSMGTSAAWVGVVSITLTPGVWVISGTVGMQRAAASWTNTNGCQLAISTTNASLAGTEIGKTLVTTVVTGTTNDFIALAIPFYTVNITTSTTYFLNARASWTSTAPNFNGGSIQAVRIR